jgi:MarR family transcriptional regulator, organic hydroperoxide resistance regulator
MRNDTQNILHHWREAVPNDRMAHLIRDTERAFRKALQVRLAAYDVPFGHWTFLRVLWENEGLTQKELSAHAGVMEPTTFAAMKAMEAQGYIVRKQLPTNRKNVYIHLSAKGRALKKKLVPLAEDTNSISTKNISPDDLMTTRKVLLAMIENLAEDESAWEAQAHNHPPKRRARGKAGK